MVIFLVIIRECVMIKMASFGDPQHQESTVNLIKCFISLETSILSSSQLKTSRSSFLISF